MSQLLQSQTFLRAFSGHHRKEQSIVESLQFHFQRIIKEKFVRVASSSQLAQFNDLLIKYLENSLVFIANDTDRQLQFINFTKEQELTLVAVILVLTGHLMMHYSETRYKHLVELFKTLQANVPGLSPYFYLNTLSPRQLQLDEGKPPSSNDRSMANRFADRMLTMFNYKSTLFDCFDLFTRIFFSVTSSLATDADLRINLMELYQHVFRGLRELQKQKLNAQRDEAPEVPGTRPAHGGPLTSSISLFQSGRSLRATILTMLRSSFFTLHELASVHSKVCRVTQTAPGASVASQVHLQLGQQEGRQVANLCKNFRQHVSAIIDYTLDSY